jgi:hypothetical protein
MSVPTYQLSNQMEDFIKFSHAIEGDLSTIIFHAVAATIPNGESSDF